MAITRIYQSGAENGLGEILSQGVTTLRSDAARTGTYYFRADAHNNESVYWNIPDTRQVRAGQAMRWNSFGTLSGGDHMIVHDGVTKLIEVEPVIANGNLLLKVAGVQQDVTIDTPCAIPDIWYHLAMDCKIDNVAGWAYVYLDGVLILSFDGNTGNVNVDRIRFGTRTDVGVGPFYFDVDDVYIDDTTGEAGPEPPPILRFYPVRPNGNGNYSQWDGSDGNQVDNYLLVDEVLPNGDTDYVETDTVDEFDSYDMSTIVLDSNEEIMAVIPIVNAKHTDGTEEIAVGTRLAGTNLVGADQVPGIAYAFFWERQTAKPGGGAWGQNDINDFEVLLKSRGTY